METLSSLNRHVGVGDAGMKALAGMPKLKLLSLHFTHVTDTGLTELAGLMDLQNLDLRYTKVTAAGVKTLQKSLIGCSIEH